MKKTIALSLSGGGARGFAHLGVIFELERQGYHISSISGSSIGALIASIVAAGKILPFTDFILGLKEKEISKFLKLTIDSKGFVSLDYFFKNQLKEFLPQENIEDLSVPLTIIATDLTTCTARIFKTGSIYEALKASIAIPAVIKPEIIKENVLVDGCILNPLPLSETLRKKDDLLVGVNLYGKNTYINKSGNNEMSNNPFQYLSNFKKHFVNAIFEERHFFGPITIIRKSMNLMVQQLIYNSIELNKPDIVIDIPMNCCAEFDFEKGKELIKLGIAQTQKALKEL